jgi:hypothetical protein
LFGMQSAAGDLAIMALGDVARPKVVVIAQSSWLVISILSRALRSPDKSANREMQFCI